MTYFRSPCSKTRAARPCIGPRRGPSPIPTPAPATVAPEPEESRTVHVRLEDISVTDLRYILDISGARGLHWFVLASGDHDVAGRDHHRGETHHAVIPSAAR